MFCRSLFPFRHFSVGYCVALTPKLIPFLIIVAVLTNDEPVLGSFSKRVTTAEMERTVFFGTTGYALSAFFCWLLCCLFMD
jgi:hypothetical protein